MQKLESAVYMPYFFLWQNPLSKPYVGRYAGLPSHGVYLQRRSHRGRPVHLHPARPLLPEVV